MPGVDVSTVPSTVMPSSFSSPHASVASTPSSGSNSEPTSTVASPGVAISGAVLSLTSSTLSICSPLSTRTVVVVIEHSPTLTFEVVGVSD